MYKFTYFDSQVKLMLSERKAFWDPELEQELSPVLEVLKQSGEIEGASCGVKPGVSRLVYELKGRTFHITYTVDASSREIKFYDFLPVCHPFDWKAALEQDLRENEEQPIYIPQIGDPHKFIRAIELIHSGINTSRDLGIKFGSKANRDRDLTRRGDYLVRPLMELGLAVKIQSERQSQSINVLTDRGRLIAGNSDQETRERLLVEALLGFYPIQMIIDETTLGGKELTKELIQDVISLVSRGDYGGTTNPRRASSVRKLVIWVSRWAGISIRREGIDGVQLYIPYI